MSSCWPIAWLIAWRSFWRVNDPKDDDHVWCYLEGCGLLSTDHGPYGRENYR
jgi:hypothetical protein